MDADRAVEAAATRKLAERLEALAGEIEGGSGGRDDGDQLVAELRGVQNRAFGPRPRAPRGHGGKAKILDYLLQRLGEVVYGEELAAASGISEWARRVRELRVQDGYRITELGGSRYRLEAAEPDLAEASAWALENTIRRRSGSGKSRIEALLEASVGEVVDRKQIDYVSNIGSAARRVRELRDEKGWPINSHIDEPALRPGQYRLTSADPADRLDPLQRQYPEDLRQRVFERDDYTCRRCGRDRAKAEAAGDTRFYLEVHHRVALADEDRCLSQAELNDLANLEALCHRCHSEETAKLQRRKRSQRG
ncbi:MAG TPA: HNH endonuclease signature motif containing protein [Solirubrobacterales bacterium]|nr:HNH endonuclease signature motif containing protein [Solirubrobacterales bacterium]